MSLIYEAPLGKLSARIAEVDPGSSAERAGIVAGDLILSVEGEPVTDLIDWMWRADSGEVEIEIQDESGIIRSIELVRESGESWGIVFEDAVFDEVKRCHNACAFCFMNQLPQGMRETLYLKDDDYRLSFLQGNFVTLTNLSEEDIQRIVEQRISPLNVSFHASNPLVRERLIGKRAEKGLENFIILAENDIEMNIQIVLVPQVNDGKVLDETIQWLKQYKEAIPAIGIVPVAYTDQTTEIAGLPPKSFTKQIDAAQVISQVQLYQFEARAESEKAGDPKTWIHLADEFYINALAPFPKEEWYDGYPLYENGIGMVWNFVDEVKENLQDLNDSIQSICEDSEAATVITGELALDTLVGTLSAANAAGRVRLLPVHNFFFGGNVSVTGLLTGQDLVNAIRYDLERLDQQTTYLIPDIIFNADDRTLDDFTREDIIEQTQAAILFHQTGARGLIDAFRTIAGRQ